MKQIYIVIGNTGEYSDFRQWNVCAYMSEKSARARVTELDMLMKSIGAKWDQDGCVEAMRNNERGDRSFEIDYTGTTYYYNVVELKDG